MILIDGYKYRLYKDLKTGVKCWKWNHIERHKNYFNRQILSDSLKRKTVEDVAKRPMKIVHEKLCKAKSTP